MTRQIVSFFASPRQCPACGGEDVRRSRRKSLKDRLAALALMRPFRCADCDVRHYAFLFRKRIPQPNDNKQLKFEFPARTAGTRPEKTVHV